jgi:predicted GNAT family N-acyltransferase
MYSVYEPSSPEQLEKIFALRYAILRAPWNQPKGSERDEQEHVAIHAMITDEAGNCIATGRLQLNNATEGQIRFMAVSELHRGKKLGKQILDFLEAKARERECRKIVLQARENAVEFYLANGYTIEEKTFLLFDSIQHYRMSKKLR